MDGVTHSSEPNDLVGRGEQLEALLGTCAGPPGFAVIHGEAGIGKTRLVAELARNLTRRGFRYLWGCCQPTAQPIPLAPIVEAVRRITPFPEPSRLPALAGFLRYLVPELSGRLPPAPGELADSRSHYLFRAVRDLFAAVGPTLLVVEDLHWSDRTTLDFLSFVAGDLPPNLSVVVTCRRDEISDPRFLAPIERSTSSSSPRVVIELEPLPLADTARLVSRMLDATPVSDEFASYLHEKTAGVPLAVEEAIQLLKDRRDIVRDGGAWMRRAVEELHIPASVTESITSRLEALDPGAVDILRAAATCGTDLDEDLLVVVMGSDGATVAAALAQGLGLSLLVEDVQGRTSWRHELVRQTVYQSTPGPIRRQLHLRVAAELDGTERAPPRRRIAFPQGR